MKIHYTTNPRAAEIAHISIVLVPPTAIACGVPSHVHALDLIDYPATGDPARVTCGACQRSIPGQPRRPRRKGQTSCVTTFSTLSSR